MQLSAALLRATEIDRRAFLGLSLAGLASAQAPPTGVMPPPAKAKITSSVMLMMLPGTFDEKVRLAALAGMQSVGLRDEYLAWDSAESRRAKRLIESFGMTVQTVATRTGSAADTTRALAAARQFESPYVILAGGEFSPADLNQAAKLATDDAVTLLISTVNSKDTIQRIRDLDSPHARLLFHVADEQQSGGAVAQHLKEALDLTAVVQIADAPGRGEPGTGTIDFKEIYRTLQKGGYTHIVSMEYRPKGDPVASLKRAVDQFRSAVNERAMPAAPTEGSLV